MKSDSARRRLAGWLGGVLAAVLPSPRASGERVAEGRVRDNLLPVCVSGHPLAKPPTTNPLAPRKRGEGGRRPGEGPLRTARASLLPLAAVAPRRATPQNPLAPRERGEGGRRPGEGPLRTARTSLLPLALLLTIAACTPKSDLPKLFPVPNAHLTSEANQPVQLDALKGNVVVYDFIFTNCAGSCPMMTATLRRITAKIDKGAPVRFVSISVDPKRDTPAVLRAYAAKVRNDPRWTFLTGDPETVARLSVDGFKLAAATGASPTPNESILHSSKFAIADKQGVIRAYVSAEADDAVDRVVGTVKELVRE